MQAQKPYYKITYNGKDITADVSRFLMSMQYTDHTEGESDELTLTLENVDGFWLNSWYPEKGATLTAEMGIQNDKVLQCGTFQIDEVEPSGPPDIISIKALGIGIHGKLKTKKRGRNHEGKTLSQIIHTLAATNGYSVSGNIDNISFGRIAQHNETDLQFMARLASQYGYYFSIRGKTITFTKYQALESRPESLTLLKSDITSYSFRDKTSGIYKRARVKFHNPERNVTVEYQTQDADGVFTDNELNIGLKVENEQQAKAMADANLHHANSLMQTAEITIPGNVLAVAGNNVYLNAFGKLGGLYFILNSTHSIDRGSGYSVQCEMKRVGAPKE